MYQGLIASGIEVVASMPAFTYLTKKYFSEIPEEVRENLWEWHTQDTILERVKPDAVMYSSNWDHYNLAKKPSVPLVIDLHGSRLIETSLWGHPSDTNKKVDVFSKADCFVCAGKRQRMYFYGWLTQAGRVPDVEHLIRYIPVSLSPEEFKRESLGGDAPEFPYLVSGGGWFPWQDQSKAIFSICNEVVRRNKGLVKIYGTPHDNNSASPEEMHIRSIFNEVKELSKQHPQVVVPGYVGRDALLEEYKKASVAVELMRYNLERELAFTTRTIEYLWCGLPVIYNNYAEISDHIREYDAGWTIDPESNEEISRVVDEIFSSPWRVEEKSKNAQRLVKDRFSWDKTIAPLVDFISNPQTLPASKPVKGFVVHRSPFFAPSGSPVTVPLETTEKISQSFVFPSEGIWAVEVPYRLSEEYKESLPSSLLISVAIYSKRGMRMGYRKHSLDAIPRSGAFLVPISRIFRPLGGSEARIEVRLIGSSSEHGTSSTREGVNKLNTPAILLAGLQETVFPLRESPSVQSISGFDVLGVSANAKVLQLRFHPGGTRMYHLRSMLERAYWLLRQGEFKRVVRAVSRKLPLNKSQLKALFVRS
jgi:glycosyltransferase involved in cell wall biosynthesis